MKPPRLSSTSCILRTFDGHGAYCRIWGNYYFLCAADLNCHLDPGKAWEEPEAQRRAIILLVAEIEAEPSASTSAGSFRFANIEEYSRHRHRLGLTIRAFRAMLKVRASALKLTETFATMMIAR